MFKNVVFVLTIFSTAVFFTVFPFFVLAWFMDIFTDLPSAVIQPLSFLIVGPLLVASIITGIILLWLRVKELDNKLEFYLVLVEKSTKGPEERNKSNYEKYMK